MGWCGSRLRGRKGRATFRRKARGCATDRLERAARAAHTHAATGGVRRRENASARVAHGVGAQEQQLSLAGVLCHRSGPFEFHTCFVVPPELCQ